MARCLSLLRFRVTRVLHSALSNQVRYFAAQQARGDIFDLSLDDIPTNKRPSSIVNSKTDPKPRPQTTVDDDDDEAFALAHWNPDEQATAYEDPLSSSLASSPSMPDFNSKNRSSAKKQTDRDPQKEFHDRMTASAEEAREDTQRQLAYLRAQREERKERRLARIQAEREGRKVSYQEHDEEEEGIDFDSEEEAREWQEIEALEDVAAGRAELKPDWFEPLSSTARPQTELCTSIDQFTGFYKHIVTSLYDIFAEGWDEEEIAEVKVKLEEIDEYLTNMDQGLSTLEAAMLKEDEEHKNYFLAAVGDKMEAGVKLKEIVAKCLNDIDKPGFGFAAQVRILRQLNSFLPERSGHDEAID